ncbi:PREDICTED: E3 SUMO-protein ligase NSE2 [Apaloderma vittatum]|uniref:E3 SUMO-protein ligase NSE2 n=1 Tax=Apaloderma vittatum TaxID=57397 RepID=UPI000521B7D8|nr:PREDICTED: E3 SUMO-protein ligase NSE2 [Apaloderma vittatum]
MPRAPRREKCWLTRQRAQSRLGVRDCDCSKSDVSALISRKPLTLANELLHGTLGWHAPGYTELLTPSSSGKVCHQSDNDNEAIEQIDEDIAVTQSQVNFICPITQLEMKRPVRNKICGHSYEEEAILKFIQTRKQQKKKVRCPKIGCSHADVKGSDLVPDEALKRAIDSKNKQSWSTLEKSDEYDTSTDKICC